MIPSFAGAPKPRPHDPKDPLGPPLPPIVEPEPDDPLDPPPQPNPDENNPPIVVRPAGGRRDRRPLPASPSWRPSPAAPSSG